MDVKPHQMGKKRTERPVCFEGMTGLLIWGYFGWQREETQPQYANNIKLIYINIYTKSYQKQIY